VGNENLRPLLTIDAEQRGPARTQAHDTQIGLFDPIEVIFAKGFVDDCTMLRTASEVAREAPGVAQVVNTITVSD
jgi:hypothetical protein